MTLWHASLTTTFKCAGRDVHVTLIGRHGDTGKPIVSLTWSSRPERLTAADMATFEAKRREAVAVLHQRLERLEAARSTRAST